MIIRNFAIDKPPGLPDTNLDSASVADILGLAWVVAGLIAFVMILIGSYKYVLSRGDSQAIKSAKETIIYSIVGLLITIFAYGITTFIYGRIK